MKRLHEKAAAILRFFNTDIWKTRSGKYPLYADMALKAFRLFMIAADEFKKHQCPLRASALTFYSILSIVPVVAMAYAVASGFGFEKRLEKQLLEQFPGQEAIFQKVLAYATALLNSTREDIIAGVGVAVLLWTIIKVLGHIESSLNAIWEIRNSRRLSQKITDYLSMMILAPLLVILSGSVTVFIRTQVMLITDQVDMLGMVSPALFFLLKLLPFGLIAVLFTLIYMHMPNTRVKLAPAMIAGIIAGIAYQLAQWAYIFFQVGASRNNAIYGSFAALPLFLVWLQISWHIVLFGAVLSAACQKFKWYDGGPKRPPISWNLRQALCLQIAHLSVRRFVNAEPPPAEQDIATHTGIPLPLVSDLISHLCRAGILVAVLPEKDGKTCFQPARNPEHLTAISVLSAVSRTGLNTLDIPLSETFQTLSQTAEALWDAAKKSPANRRLGDI